MSDISFLVPRETQLDEQQGNKRVRQDGTRRDSTIGRRAIGFTRGHVQLGVVCFSAAVLLCSWGSYIWCCQLCLCFTAKETTITRIQLFFIFTMSSGSRKRGREKSTFSAGPDLTPPIVFKAYSKHLIKPLFYLFNQILRTCTFPKWFKISRVSSA